MHSYPRFRWRIVWAGLTVLIGLWDEGLNRVAGQEAPASVRPVELSAAVVVRCKAATALVDVQSMGSGSSACISADGFFITNHHVVLGVGLGNHVRLVLNSGQKVERVLQGRVIKLDEENDLALLKVDGVRDLVTVPFGSDDALFETMPLTAFGYPFGRMLSADSGYPSVSVNTGAVTAVRRKGGELESIQFDASVNPGNSGGPVVDKKGNLIGIVMSGMPGARVNFAIPVSRVREFLEGPALVLRRPRITFLEREKPRPFEIDAYAFDRHSLDNLVVELVLNDSADAARTLQATRKGDRFVVEGSACASGGADLKTVLVVSQGRARISSAVPLGEVSFGSRKFAWLALDSLVKDGGEWVLSLLGGERFAGKPTGLPGVAFGAGRTTQLATADRIEVRVKGVPSSEVLYELQSRSCAKVFTPIRGRLGIENLPKVLTPSPDSAMVRTEIKQPIVVEVLVRENVEVGVLGTGLVLLPQKGQLAGMEDEQGRYVLVNGQPWYVDQGAQQQPFRNGRTMPVLPILFGLRDCQIRLLSARPEGGGSHSADRVATTSGNVMQGLTSIAVANRAKEPTRIALGITFEPARNIVPLMERRSQPVLESHWPLNDTDPTQAEDLGPAKKNGLMSSAQSVPGVRGNGILLNRQAILCPNVLPIERTDSFSCSAWVKPSPTTSLTIFSRMRNNLRGFDLSYNNKLEAHLISSWDGNAIKVSTVEQFDSSEWHHVAMTYHGSSRASGLKIYLDGALATLAVEFDRLSETIRCDAPFFIGSREGRDYYQGRVDEVRAYGRVLSADEIFEMYDLERSDLSPGIGSAFDQGLVGYWPFDGPPAERFQDKSGHGHHGTLEPERGLPEIVKSDGGQAVRLGAPWGMIDCGAVADFDRHDAYSLGAWFKPRGENSRTLMGTLDAVERGFDLMFDRRVICHLVSQWDGSAIKIITRSEYTNDVWHHVVCTYNGSSRSSGFKLYVDGVEAPFDAQLDNLTTSTKCHGYFRIGARVARDYFDGDIDDAFVYGRALLPGEAREWFTQGRNSSKPLSAGRRRGLIGYWTFEGKGGESFQDRSGNGHHGLPDVDSGHSMTVPQGSTRVARMRGVGGIDCGQAGDFERTDAFSAGGWFCWEGGPMVPLLSKIHHSGPNRGYDIEYDGDKYVAQLTHNWNDGPENSLTIQTPSIRGTGWRHIMFTYDGSSRAPGFKLYVNGELQKSTVVKESLSKSIRVREPFVIGSRLVASTMRGRASHVRLIPHELTAVEVRRLAQADRPPGLLP